MCDIIKPSITQRLINSGIEDIWLWRAVTGIFDKWNEKWIESTDR